MNKIIQAQYQVNPNPEGMAFWSVALFRLGCGMVGGGIRHH